MRDPVPPLDAGLGAALAWLVLGPAAVAAVLVWQLRAIVAAPHPRLRVINALAVGVPMLLVVFAAKAVVEAVDECLRRRSGGDAEPR